MEAGVAAWAGDRALSLKLLKEGYGLYRYGRFQQTLEYRLDKVVGVASEPYFANMGAFLTGLLFGFTGLNIPPRGPEDWPARAVVLPEGWTAIECDRLWVHGEAWSLSARHGADRAELRPADQPSS